MKIVSNSLSLGGVIAFSLISLHLQPAQAGDNRGQLSSGDYSFVTKAAQGGMNEVSLSQVAVQKATDPSVKDFAQRMVQDHQKANQELTQLATQKGATISDLSSKKVEKETEHLQKLSGSEFDVAYMKIMVSDHKQTVKLFQKESEKAEDPDLKSWATKTLPTLQQHLTMAQSAEGTVAAKP